MISLAVLPLPAGLLATFLVGLAAGAAVNWAAYARAWTRRPISPWSKPHPKAPRRRASDRIPIWGWIGLRRESDLHGPRFWLRPLVVELLMGVGFAALYWWEVAQQGLLLPQLSELAGNALPPAAIAAPVWSAMAAFAAHLVLITLMAAASLIDIDEKLIPDDITVTGTVAGLFLAGMMPLGLLPHVAIRNSEPVAAAAIELPDDVAFEHGQPYVEPATHVAPNAWPEKQNGLLGLIIGLSCFATWCVALAPRIWRGRRGIPFGVRVLARRVARELLRPPLAWIAALGAVGISSVWVLGGAAWVGLLTALVGLVGAGAMVWAVRIVGSAALGREAMGFGDVTLMMMIGTFLGWQAGVIIFFLAPLPGLIVGALQLVLRRDDVIPYGPFLCLAALSVMVWWGNVWNASPGGLQDIFALGWLVPAALAFCVIMLGAALVLWRHIKAAIFGADQQ